jgi:Skp family chaperone for outer membrane proteins
MKVLVKLLAASLPFVIAMTVSAQRPAAQATPTPSAARPAGQTNTTPARPATQQPPTTTAAAVTNLPISKMAVIISDQFLDPKTGILKFGILITKLNGEFQKTKDDLTQTQTRAQQLQDEITKLQNAPIGTPIDTKSIQAKGDQLEQLKKDIQRKSEDAQAAYTKRQGELFAPLQEDIGRALDAFAKAHNINLVIDAARVPIIYAADNMDITQAFINEFNSKNPVTAATRPPQ